MSYEGRDYREPGLESICENVLEGLASRACGIWEGRAWRLLHASRYAAEDPGGSYRVSGRYNRSRDFFGEDAAFPALYLATAPEVAMGEKQRHLTSGNLPQMKNQALSEFRVRLQTVYDLSKPEEVGIDSEALVNNHDYTFSQSLSATLRDRGAEALLVPSATLLGNNLVVFPDRLHDESGLEILGTRETRLYVPSPD